jgi:hypothetical protein
MRKDQMTTIASAVTRPAHFGLRVPDGWARFDLSDTALAQGRQQVLATTKSAADRMRVSELFREARAITQAARRRGALWGAGTATLYDDVLFLGYVMVFAVNLGDDVDMSLPMLTRQLSRTGKPAQGEDQASGWPRAVTPIRLREVGDAVRIVGTETVIVAPGSQVDMLTMHTLIPLPGGDSSEHLLLSCCSPNLPLAKQVYELFDAISSTFRFIGTVP